MHKLITSLVLCFCLAPQLSIAKDIIFPPCSTTEALETEVHLYVDDEVLTEYSKEFVMAKINAWESYSNLTLSNSCIPMTRKVTEVHYVPFLDKGLFQDLYASMDLLEFNLGYDLPQQNGKGSPIYTAAVYANASDSFKSEYCGQAAFSAPFFIIGLNCSDSTFEHEIGHLNGAQHDVGTLKEYDQIPDLEEFLKQQFPFKPAKYGFGAVCAGRGTIMSYERDRIPAYSSPELIAKGEVCGNKENADNARLLREYATKYLDKLN